MRTSPKFLNVDLDVRSARPLDALRVALGDSVLVLRDDRHDGDWFLSVEALTSAEADTVLRQLCALVERLPPAARACWDACLQRDFNLGFAGAAGRTPHESRVGTDTLARVAALGGTVTITVYPPYEPVVAPKEVRSARARNRRRRQRSLAAPRGGR